MSRRVICSSPVFAYLTGSSWIRSADDELLIQPDEWEKAQEGGGSDWEFSVRCCSEKLFLDLMINYKDTLMQPLLAVFKNVAGTCIIPPANGLLLTTKSCPRYRNSS